MPLPHRARAAGRPLVVVAMLTLLLPGLLSGCSGDDRDAGGPGGPAPAPPADVALADLADQALVVRRQAFCEAVADEAVGTALGGAPDDAEAYGNGEVAPLTGSLRDVSHEYGCTWRTDDRATARAWLFAPPVTPGSAEDLTRGLRDTEGCRPLAGAPAYGDPGAAVVCRTGPVRRVERAGLFGDAWLTCSLTLPRDVRGRELEERSDRWCAAVLMAAARLEVVTG